jgi:hypothetical protein
MKSSDLPTIAVPITNFHVVHDVSILFGDFLGFAEYETFDKTRTPVMNSLIPTLFSMELEFLSYKI